MLIESGTLGGVEFTILCVLAGNEHELDAKTNITSYGASDDAVSDSTINGSGSMYSLSQTLCLIRNKKTVLRVDNVLCNQMYINKSYTNLELQGLEDNKKYSFAIEFNAPNTLEMQIAFNYKYSNGNKKTCIVSYDCYSYDGSGLIDQSVVDGLQSQITQLTTDKTNLTNQLNTANQTISDKNAQIAQLNSQITQLTTDKTNLTNQLNTANQTISNKNTEIDNLNTQIAQLNSQINQLTTDKTNLTNQLNTANQTISNKNTEIENLNNQITQLTTDKTNLTNQLNTANQTISDKNTEIENLNNQITQLTQNIDELNTLVNQLREEIESLNSNSDSTVVDLQLAKQKIIELENDKIKLNDRINQLLSQIDNLNSTISNLTSQLNNANDNISNLHDEITGLNGEISQYILEIESLNTTITNLNREIELLRSQISNSGSNNSELLEKLNRAEKEIDKLNNEVLLRIQQIENKLDDTNIGMTNNSIDIEEMKSSLIRDITAALGTPRFGFVPLPLAKQAIATSGELLSDAKTGHVYFKNGNTIVSKTIEMEDDIEQLMSYNKSTWMAISIDSDNYHLFTNKDNIFSNANNTLSTNNLKMEFDKVTCKFDPLTLYTISIKVHLGSINKVYFVDENGNKFNCTLKNSSESSFIYSLDDISIGNTMLYPIIEVNNANTAISNILVYKSLSNNIDDNSDDNSFGGTDIDDSLIGDNTIVNNDKSFTVNVSHPITVTIPTNSLKTGMYTLILRVRGNNTSTFTAKTVFNGSVFETKNIDFSKIISVAGGKTGFAEMNIPIVSSSPNYIEISSNSTSNIIVDYFVMSLVDFNRHDFYTKEEINSKDIPTGKTSNSGNSYTLTTPLVTEYYDGLLCKIKINSTSTGNVTFRCNSLEYINVVDANGNRVSKMVSGIWYHVCYNSETKNFTLLGKGGGGNAQPNQVIKNMKFTNDDGEHVGTMPISTFNKSINCGIRAMIPLGYHDGTGYVESNTLESQTQGNATKRTILKGYKAWVNGQLVDGDLDIPMGSTIFKDLFSTRHWGSGSVPYGITAGSEIYTDTPDDYGRHQTIYYKNYITGEKWEHEYLSNKYWTDKGTVFDLVTKKFYVYGYNEYGGAYGCVYEIDMVNHTTTQIWRCGDNYRPYVAIVKGGDVYAYCKHRTNDTISHRIYVNDNIINSDVTTEQIYNSSAVSIQASKNYVYIVIALNNGTTRLLKLQIGGSLVRQLDIDMTAIFAFSNLDDDYLYVNGNGILRKYDKDFNLVYSKNVGQTGQFIIYENYILFSGGGVVSINKDTGNIVNNTNYSWAGSSLYLDYETLKPIVSVRVSASGADYRYYKAITLI